MVRPWRSSALTALLAASVIPVASAQTAADDDVIVRSYNTFGVSLDTLAKARAATDAALEEAGLHVGWRDCRTSGGPSAGLPDACDDLLGPREVVMRIVATPAAARDLRVLGFSLVDMRLKRGTLGTVYADRIAVVADRLNIDHGTLLGRAIAHEVGHLLLGTTSHSRRGLMRGRWEVDDYPDSRGQWLFSREEAVHMRQALSARVVGENAQATENAPSNANTQAPVVAASPAIATRQSPQ